MGKQRHRTKSQQCEAEQTEQDFRWAAGLHLGTLEGTEATKSRKSETKQLPGKDSPQQARVITTSEQIKSARTGSSHQAQPISNASTASLELHLHDSMQFYFN